MLYFSKAIANELVSYSTEFPERVLLTPMF